MISYGTSKNVGFFVKGISVYSDTTKKTKMINDITVVKNTQNSRNAMMYIWEWQWPPSISKSLRCFPFYSDVIFRSWLSYPFLQFARNLFSGTCGRDTRLLWHLVNKIPDLNHHFAKNKRSILILHLQTLG